jgi:hypothetical protein
MSMGLDRCWALLLYFSTDAAWSPPSRSSVEFCFRLQSSYSSIISPFLMNYHLVVFLVKVSPYS